MCAPQDTRGYGLPLDFVSHLPMIYRMFCAVLGIAARHRREGVNLAPSRVALAWRSTIGAPCLNVNQFLMNARPSFHTS